MNANKLRMPIDISMTILSLLLMGGTVIFSFDIVHEILGMALFVLWALHIWLNHRWYGSILRGKYNAYRLMQTFVNIGILVCVILLIISGILLSHHIFTFLKIEWGFGFARISHLVASHWYFLLMSIHLGLHAGMILKKMKVPSSGKKSLILKILLLIIFLYGLYAFVSRGVWRYLILKQQFFFFDMEKGCFLFVLDYLAIIVLFASLGHFAAKKMQSRINKKVSD